MKTNQHITNKKQFRTHTTVSPEEIFAAGGGNSFWNKIRQE